MYTYIHNPGPSNGNLLAAFTEIVIGKQNKIYITFRHV